MYAATISADCPGARSMRRIGSVFVNGVIERSMSIAPLGACSGFACAPNAPAEVTDDPVAGGESSVTIAYHNALRGDHIRTVRKHQVFDSSACPVTPTCDDRLQTFASPAQIPARRSRRLGVTTLWPSPQDLA